MRRVFSLLLRLTDCTARAVGSPHEPKKEFGMGDFPFDVETPGGLAWLKVVQLGKVCSNASKQGIFKITASSVIFISISIRQ